MAAARGPASARKMQEGVPAKSDLEDMRLQTDALVSEFSEHYRDAVLTPAKTSAHLTPSHKSSSRLESATVVRIPVSSPSNNLIGVTSPHPLSHAPPKNISPPPLRAQQVLTAATAPSASSSDFVNELYSYFRAMLTQAQAETSQAREELTKQNQQLAQANSLNSELRRAIAMRDGCLEHANSVITQLQEHKFHLYSIIDNFRAQQASSKSQIDLQARSLISKERHIFSLSENIERLQAESTNHQKSCEEALQFMLQECQAASRERDAALREVVSLRHQITHSKSLKSGSTGLGSASRKAMIASLDVGPRPEPFVNSKSSTITPHAVTAVTHTDSNACKDAHNTVSPLRDHAVYFYLAHSHKKQPYAAMYGTQTSPAVVDGTHSPDFSKRKLLMDLFGDESSLGSSRKVPESGHSEGVESIALEQEIAKHNLLVTRSSLTGSSGSTPTANQSLSASNSNSLVAGSSTGKESRVFTNQQRRRSAARSLASTLAASQHGSDVHSPPSTPPLGSAHAIETIGTMENVRLWAALMAADADTSDS